MTAREFLIKERWWFLNWVEQEGQKGDLDDLLESMDEYAAVRTEGFFRWYCNYKLNTHEGQEKEIIKEWLESITPKQP